MNFQNECPFNNLIDRIGWKVKNSINELTRDEHECLIDMLIDRYSERITRLNNELLIEEAIEKGFFDD